MAISNSQATELGKRLRQGPVLENDLSMLDEFRQTFSDVDEQAWRTIRSALATVESIGCTMTKRKRKTQQSIVDKLRRQPRLRLPQMQDIAGCRIVIEGGVQDASHLSTLLTDAFEPPWVLESKDRHAHGYRATHIIASTVNQAGQKKGQQASKKFYEIQLRTWAQDIWANLVESLSDQQNTLKYGGSEQEQALMNQLTRLAERFSRIDQQAHQVSFSQYQHQIEEAIKDVLSH
ncbi:MAG: RelA/SpoT domain-containing protein [Marinobacterium sp.]|nr:RelA/SpoT domain-containing protein [Marinobacterium sp.]